MRAVPLVPKEIDVSCWIGYEHGAATATVGMVCHPPGHSKRTAELRVVIHALRDWCRQTPEDWATWQDGIQ